MPLRVSSATERASLILERLELVDFRNYAAATFELTPGTTVVVGDNGQGKTNLAEALAYLATLSSFRGVSTDALVRVGAANAVIRAELRDDDGRQSLIEAEITPTGPGAGAGQPAATGERRATSSGCCGSPCSRPTTWTWSRAARASAGGFSTTPRRLAVKYDAVRLELDRILRQRNTLLRQLGGRLDRRRRDDPRRVGQPSCRRPASSSVGRGPRWSSGPAHTSPRAYAQLAGSATVTSRWSMRRPGERRGLAAALAAARDDDVRRGVSTVGPHRDELELSIGGMPARTHASQGEQRTLALALRLGVHHLVAERTGSTPVLVLDDVLSELDAHRASALLRLLPAGQIVITTAGDDSRRGDTPSVSSASPTARSSSHDHREHAAGVTRAGDDDPLSLADSLDGVVRSMQGGARRPTGAGAGDGWGVRAVERDRRRGRRRPRPAGSSRRPTVGRRGVRPGVGDADPPAHRHACRRRINEVAGTAIETIEVRVSRRPPDTRARTAGPSASP